MMPSAVTDLVVRPLTPERWPGLEALFNGEGCSMARGCWCMADWRSGKVTAPSGRTPTEFNRPGLRALAEAGKPAPSAKSMYGRAGFTEVARRKLERPVERLTVAHFRRDRPTGSSAP